VQIPGRRARSRDTLTFSAASHPPLAAACFALVLALTAVLVLAGFDLGSELLTYFVALGAAFVLSSLVGRLRPESVVEISEGSNGRELRLWHGRRAAEIHLDELASVRWEHDVGHPTLTLTDLRGASLTIPLGTWTDEERLLEELEAAARAAGASGSVGHAVPVRKPPWIAPTRFAAAAVTALALFALVVELRDDEPAVERVTPTRIEATSGGTTSPFAGSRPCSVYVVPLDRPSEERANDIARALTRFPVLPCAMPSLALDTRALEPEREQLDGSILAGSLSELFVAEWKERPSTIIGITEHDLFSSADPSLRFVFGFAFGNLDLQGFAAISTARMGSGEARMRRLETMVVRYVGLHYFGLEPSEDSTSALYRTITGRADLDRMRPELAEPPPSQIDLRNARAQFLFGGG
jgi:hypothetical protein